MLAVPWEQIANTLTMPLATPLAMLKEPLQETSKTREPTPLPAEPTTPLLPLLLLMLLFTAHTLDQLEEMFAEPIVKFTAKLSNPTAKEPTHNTLIPLLA